ncbi:hypothetical protein RHGRI_000297 [Rhododendron griersonianum]|uniref:Uncharacterized protein n=1 Tax=Rhododendron griersonianum TaxID=479676 RepID=A0AAV6LH77_9ERIC|nr:hypothetical protein RHGRI_000297 [Rhododendron griersonianum]
MKPSRTRLTSQYLHNLLHGSQLVFREVKRAQANCFPKVGEIRADGLMIYCEIVKQKLFFYHLPDLLPVKHVFQEEKGTWFIHMEVCTWRVSDKLCLPECPAAQIRDQTSKILVSTLTIGYRVFGSKVPSIWESTQTKLMFSAMEL